MKRLDLQHLKIEKLEEMRAQLIPKFLRRPLRQEIFEVPTSHQRHRQHLVRRVLPKDARNLNERKRLQAAGKKFDIIGFSQVVCFGDDLLFNLINRGLWYMTR